MSNYLKQLILKVPATLNYNEFAEDEANADIVEALEAIDFFVIGQLVGSREYNSRKLLHCIVDSDRDAMQEIITDLDWSISAFEGDAVIQNRVLSHLLPDYVFGEDGEPEEVPITDCTGRLSTLAGRDWTY